MSAAYTYFFIEPGFIGNAEGGQRIGWSNNSPDSYGLISDLSNPNWANGNVELTPNGTQINEVYYDSINNTFNVTVGTSIAGSVITSSSVYAAGTAYVPGNVVSRGTNGPATNYYMCVQAGTGQDPESSPTYWQLCTVFYWPYGVLVVSEGLFAGSPMITPPAYSASVTYYENAIVEYNGTSYTCLGTTTGNEPPNATYWSANAAPAADSLAVLEAIPNGVAIYGSPLVDNGQLLSGLAGFDTLHENFLRSPSTEMGNGFVRFTWQVTEPILALNPPLGYYGVSIY